MPRREDDSGEHDVAARYALHRLFVKRHGWYTKGLELAGGLRNASSPSEILTERVPAHILELFEEKVDGRGLNLHQVAVLAPTSEHLVHDEAKGRMQGAFSEHGVSAVEGRLDKARGHDLWPWEALDFYKAARGGQWQFPEAIVYLPELGELDESDAQDPSVVVELHRRIIQLHRNPSLLLRLLHRRMRGSCRAP